MRDLCQTFGLGSWGLGLEQTSDLSTQRGHTLRPAAAADIPAIVRITNAAYAIEKFFVGVDRTDADAVRRLMTKGTFLVEDGADGAVAGSVYVEVRGARGYFGLLSVDPARQGTGLGRKLVYAAEAHVRTAGARAMDIRVVNLRTELPPFYRKLGYVEAGEEHEPIPHATRPCHYLLMTKTLT